MTARAVAAPAPVEPAAGPADADAKTNNASTVAALTDPSSEQKLHVLLVEDDHATLVFVKALLKSCGHQGTCLSRARSRRARRPARAAGADPFGEFARVFNLRVEPSSKTFFAAVENRSSPRTTRRRWRLTAFSPIVPNLLCPKQSRPR